MCLNGQIKTQEIFWSSNSPHDVGKLTPVFKVHADHNYVFYIFLSFIISNPMICTENKVSLVLILGENLSLICNTYTE